MKRILSLWLPHLATDRPTRRWAPLAGWRGRPLATVTAAQGGQRLAAANAAAQRLGVQAGQTVADARALVPDLKTVAAAPADDMAALAAIADWCGRWTPWTAVDGLEDGGAGGVWLDVSGCAHLFGGEAALVGEVVERLEDQGFTAMAGLADTPGAAWAAARFGREPGRRAAIVPEGAARQWLAGLPAAALRLSPATLDTLHRLGLRRIADLYPLPRAPLAARFGDEVARRLDQLTGRAPEPLSPRRPPAPLQVRLAFADPIGRRDDVDAALRRLLAALCARLEKEGLGARRLELAFYRVDGTVARLEIGTARPARQPAHLARLFADDLDTVDAGFGIEAMTLAAPVAEPLAAEQAELTQNTDGARPGLGLLVDRLGNRLGRGGVTRPVPRASHLPERAVRPAAPLAREREAGGWPPVARPPRLLPRPERVDAAAAGFGPPPLFRWRNETHHLARAEGPERIAAEWWHAATPPPPSAVRDYWRVEDEAGRRFWLFRERERGAWFVHGVFA